MPSINETICNEADKLKTTFENSLSIAPVNNYILSDSVTFVDKDGILTSLVMDVESGAYVLIQKILDTRSLYNKPDILHDLNIYFYYLIGKRWVVHPEYGDRIFSTSADLEQNIIHGLAIGFLNEDIPAVKTSILSANQSYQNT